LSREFLRADDRSVRPLFDPWPQIVEAHMAGAGG
jgi:hypothetical protein